MQALIEKILTGDSDAVLVFYKDYAPRILKYLIAHLPRREDAEEILNDVFLDALDSLPLFQNKCSLKTWLYTIARNKVTDFYRKKKIKSILLSQAPFLEIVDAEVHQPEFQFEKEKIEEKLEIAFHALSKRYREILQLRYEEKVPVKEIAVQLHLSFKATESMLFRARTKFKHAYERA